MPRISLTRAQERAIIALAERYARWHHPHAEAANLRDAIRAEAMGYINGVNSCDRADDAAMLRLIWDARSGGSN